MAENTLSPSIVASVRQIVCSGTVTPSPAGVARALNMSTRTLQRRLYEASKTLSAVVDDVRRDTAFERLLSGVPIAKVSVMLGFSESRAFFRAFRRWTGTTPRRWRLNATLQAGPAVLNEVSSGANDANGDCPEWRTESASSPFALSTAAE